MAALNAIAADGVNRDNNAAVKLVEAMGPAFFKENPRLYLKAMGLDLPEKGNYYISLSDFASKEGKAAEVAEMEADARANPWTADRHPLLVRWIEANAQAASKTVAASNRSRFYVPYVLSSPNMPMIAEVRAYPSVQLVDLLLVRANLAIGEGWLDEAWGDILAVYRIGQLVGQDLSVSNRIIGVMIAESANKIATRLSFHEKMSEQLARKALSDLQTLGPPVDIARAVDVGDRFLELDCRVKLSLDPSAAEKFLDPGLPFGGKDPVNWRRFLQRVLQHPDIRKRLDWNALLIKHNNRYDSLVRAMALPTYAQQLKAYILCENEGKDAMAKVKTIWADPSVIEPSEEQVRKIDTQWVEAALSVDLFCGPGNDTERMILNSQRWAQTEAVRRDMVEIAMAMAAYKASKKDFPPDLSELSPAYLKAVPKDFFSGENFIYELKVDGYILYSVGTNAKDDGGIQTPEIDEMGNVTTLERDIVLESTTQPTK